MFLKQLKYHEIHYPYDPMAGYSMDLVDLTDGGQYQCRTKDGKFTHDIRVVESGEWSILL